MPITNVVIIRVCCRIQAIIDRGLFDAKQEAKMLKFSDACFKKAGAKEKYLKMQKYRNTFSRVNIPNYFCKKVGTVSV